MVRLTAAGASGSFWPSWRGRWLIRRSCCSSRTGGCAVGACRSPVHIAAVRRRQRVVRLPKRLRAEASGQRCPCSASRSPTRRRFFSMTSRSGTGSPIETTGSSHETSRWDEVPAGRHRLMVVAVNQWGPNALSVACDAIPELSTAAGWEGTELESGWKPVVSVDDRPLTEVARKFPIVAGCPGAALASRSRRGVDRRHRQHGDWSPAG